MTAGDRHVQIVCKMHTITLYRNKRRQHKPGSTSYSCYNVMIKELWSSIAALALHEARSNDC